MTVETKKKNYNVYFTVRLATTVTAVEASSEEEAQKLAVDEFEAGLASGVEIVELEYEGDFEIEED